MKRSLSLLPQDVWDSLPPKKKKEFLDKNRKEIMTYPRLYLHSTIDSYRTVHGSSRNHQVCQKAVGAVEDQQLLPIFAFDIQHLFLQAIENNIASFKPRWCKLLRQGCVSHVLLVVVPGMTKESFNNYHHCFEHLKEKFDQQVELIPPTLYASSFLDEILRAPVSRNQIERTPTCATSTTLSATPSLDLSACRPDYLGRRAKEADAAAAAVAVQVSTSNRDTFSRQMLLLSLDQQIEENYPLPGTDEPREGYVMTATTYAPVTDDSPMFGVDCEMVRTADSPQALARVSVVNEQLECIYDTLVKPKSRILDYLSQYSGMTAKLLRPVTTTLEDVQRKLQEVLPPDAILCGHSLNFDLHALKMFHPYVIDSSVIYRVSRFQAKSKLRVLTHMLLGKVIQGDGGHCSIEDARSSLQLALLKLRNGLWYGDVRFPQFSQPAEVLVAEHEAMRRFHSLYRTGTMLSVFELIKAENAKNSDRRRPLGVSVVDRDANAHLYADHLDYIDRIVYARSDRSLVKRACEVMLDHSATIVHLNNLEAKLHGKTEEELASRAATEDAGCSNEEGTASSQEDVEVYLRKLDKNLRKLYEAAADRSLVMVSFTGSGSAQDQEPKAGLCFVKTKQELLFKNRNDLLSNS